MPSLPPPLVPQKLRGMLKDYPEDIALAGCAERRCGETLKGDTTL
jgi:hypothetical protein